MPALDVIIAAAIAIVAYAWLLFPLLLRRTAGRRRPAAPPAGVLPPVGIILAAHNEEKHIGERLANIAALDYPPEKLHVLVGVDGSTDRTAELARAAQPALRGLEVFDFPRRRGKISVLKDLVAASRDAVLVFTDANTAFEKGALRALLRHLSDPAIGGVCGRLCFHDPSGLTLDEGVYWRWETRLKQLESLIDSCLGANGAIYAIRRELFWPDIPANTIVDDLVIGMKVREQGFRMVYDAEAVAHEELPDSVDHEWSRRVRIGAGAFQALILCRRCLRPSFGAFAWMFMSHKVLRWFTPHCLLLATLAAALRFAREFADAAPGGIVGALVAAARHAPLASCWLAGAAAAWLCAAAGRRIGGAPHALARGCRLADYFLTMQTALFCGFLRFCRGGLSGAWERTAR